MHSSDPLLNFIKVYFGKYVRVTAEYNPVDGKMLEIEPQPRELALYPARRMKTGSKSLTMSTE